MEILNRAGTVAPIGNWLHRGLLICGMADCQSALLRADCSTREKNRRRTRIETMNLRFGGAVLLRSPDIWVARQHHSTGCGDRFIESIHSLKAGLLILLATISIQSADPNPFSRPNIAGYEQFFRNQHNDTAQAGELLFSELGCINCHIPEPEIAERFSFVEAPRLEGIGHRVQPRFLREWLENPHAVKPGTTMPDLLGHLPKSVKAGNVRALEQFLLSVPYPAVRNDVPKDMPGNINRGMELYQTVGCVACHSIDPNTAAQETWKDSNPDIPDSISSVHFPGLRRKYTEASLAAFLIDPLKIRPSGRMPRIPLSEPEACDIAAYLISDSSAPSEIKPVNESERSAIDAGKEQFQLLGCAACHSVKINGNRLTSLLRAPSLKQLARRAEGGCLSPAPRNGLPYYPLETGQRAAISEALKSIETPRSFSSQENLERQLIALNCFVCHRRNGRGGPNLERNPHFKSSGEDLGDEGRIPPDLTRVGAKLTATAMVRILTGQGSVRPYMMTRMPDFGLDHSQNLASLFEKADLLATPRPTLRDGNENQVGRNAWGRSLVGISALNCIACHNLNGAKSPGISVLDLASAPHRLRPEWFRDYLIDPTRFRLGTRMPAFWPAGKPLLPGYGGTTDRQIDSIWAYLNEIDQSRLPEGMEIRGDFKLRPSPRPIVFRTFMKGAGMHAVAVGFPQGVHAAFDTKNMRWALAWKGDFLDAESTWDDRFTPLTPPLGHDVIALEPNLSVARLTESNATWPSKNYAASKGYRLDKDGVPTFHYHFKGVDVEDRISPNESANGLVRSLRLRGSPSLIIIRLAAGKTITPLANLKWRVSDGKTVVMRFSENTRPILCNLEGSQELRLPVDLGLGPIEIEWEIQW